jgi:SAM-dependent methyltransferase
MPARVSWSKLFSNRREIHKRYGDIWDIGILKKRLPLMLSIIRDGDRILDVGSSTREWDARVKEHYPHIVYKNMDVDEEGCPDYRTLGEIDETFDIVFLFEVIEHLSLEDGLDMLKTIHALLSNGGHLILTTPNIFNPSRFWRDATHKVAYCYDELGGILLGSGFSIVSMHRTYNDAFHRFLFRVYIMAPLFRFLGIDFTKSILIVARKEQAG